MHLYSERVSCSDESSTKMSNAALDVRLRRQIPVTAKPPRLRLGIRSSLQSKCLQQDISANHAPSVAADRFSMSCFERKSCHNQTDGHNEIGKKVTNGIRPIIHHQRHNLKNRFLLIKTLGEGTYGKVKLASDKATGEHVSSYVCFVNFSGTFFQVINCEVMKYFIYYLNLIAQSYTSYLIPYCFLAMSLNSDSKECFLNPNMCLTVIITLTF